MIIGILGSANSGKSTVGNIIKNKYNYTNASFADSLKEAISVIFDWPVEMLAGNTKESRKWREEVDEWWANRLGIENLTPRWVLQKWGTEVGRYAFHQEIWIASFEKKVLKNGGNIVIGDCRFKNEIDSIKKHNGIIIRVNRGEKPIWYDTATRDIENNEMEMSRLYSDIHISEWGWINEKFDYVIENDGNIEDLKIKVDEIMKNIE
jgi:hypothetical protein